jgi:hypothetical protein
MKPPLTPGLRRRRTLLSKRLHKASRAASHASRALTKADSAFAEAWAQARAFDMKYKGRA